MIAAFDYKRFKQRHLMPAFSWLRTEKRFWSRASECQEAYQITVEIMSGILQVYSQDRYAQDRRDEGKNEIYQTGSI